MFYLLRDSVNLDNVAKPLRPAGNVILELVVFRKGPSRKVRSRFQVYRLYSLTCYHLLYLLS